MPMLTVPPPEVATTAISLVAFTAIWLAEKLPPLPAERLETRLPEGSSSSARRLKPPLLTGTWVPLMERLPEADPASRMSPLAAPITLWIWALVPSDWLQPKLPAELSLAT